MKLILTVAVALFAGAAAASTAKLPAIEGITYLEGGKLTYEVFEVSVDHVDLDKCPAGLDLSKVFCRMTLASEQANIFIFLNEGDQHLIAVKHYPLDEGFLTFQ